MLHRSPARAGLRTLTFTLPLEWAGRASVVGNFNDWTPGRLTLSADGDVARASVELPDDYIAVFRYLGEGDHWFDEPEADMVDGGGSVVWPEPWASGVVEVEDAPEAGEPAPAKDAAPRKPSPAEKAKKVGKKRREREEEKAREAAEEARKKSRKLADKVAKASDKQRKAAERVARERERMAAKQAKKAAKKA
ncbi:hypothetical protein H5397_00410 [Propioniciclava sp. MC1683]|uniref:hypothetical protein n=1 Tax=Propioniciclava sp. MC1683 TaxID=2760309 RepID=UPI001600F5F9|nr:hypothetical protein [Propioniciclava sp. MC1683]MBB1499908.1 hypothetical protein [Propioniciclava sp. MC1683]